MSSVGIQEAEQHSGNELPCLQPSDRISSMTTIDDYKDTILSSKLLDPYQRDAMLDGAQELPEDFLQFVTKILTDFDTRSQKREAEYKEKLQEVFAKYKHTIQSMSDISDEEKKKLLDESETLASSVLLTG